MPHGFQGIYFKFARAVVKLFFPGRAVNADKTLSPACYLAHYQSFIGPVFSMVHMPIPVRPWVLSVFCDRKECYRQYMDYTFTVRFAWPRVIAAPVCFILSCIIAPLYRSMGSIPVFRGSSRIRETLSKSIDALCRGESIIIFPDIDYADKSDEVGEIYSGFLNLEKFYFKATGKHLPFIPVYCMKDKRIFEIGDPLYFSGDLPFKDEKEIIVQKLSDAMNKYNMV